MWPLAVDSIILKSTSDTKNDKNIFQEAVLIVFEHLELCQSTLVYDYSSYELLFFFAIKNSRSHLMPEIYDPIE